MRGTWNGQRSWPRRRVGCHAGHADTEGLQKVIFTQAGFIRGAGDTRRVVEQQSRQSSDIKSELEYHRQPEQQSRIRLVQSTCTASSRSGAGLCRDSSGEGGVHEPASRPPFQQGIPNRGSGVRRLGAARSRADGPGCHLVLRGRVRKKMAK